MRAAAPAMETVADLKTLATKLNPAVGYWDPLKLSEQEFWDNTNEETIGWLRHAEIKHGRIAMAGFVGYCVTANGIKFPWEPFASITATTPPEQWDALPEKAKWQIILGVGFLEWWSELRLEPGAKHYMKGGKPGYVPNFDSTPDQLPHWIGLNLWDPFKFTSGLSPAQKEKLLTEVNNGRTRKPHLLRTAAAARARYFVRFSLTLCFFAIYCAQALRCLGSWASSPKAKIPGSVPLLKGIIPEYAGEVMKPLADFS